jgi:hypothetical protein
MLEKSKEKVMTLKKLFIILAHAFVGWALCFATIGIGFAVTTQQNALIAHALGAPLYFALVSVNYFKRFNYTTPLQTAMIFLGLVMLLDFFVVSLLILRSLEMFTSPLGTWLPFALIFASTYLTGALMTRRVNRASPAQ